MNWHDCRGAERYTPEGYRMIDLVEIRNFKCYEHVKLENCRRLNIITGDNGGGKTALLEALFFVLGYHVEIGFRLKNWRGIPTANGYTPNETEMMLWQDLFFGFDTNRLIQIDSHGSAAETRSVIIGRGSEAPLPGIGVDATAPIRFVWKDVAGTVSESIPIPNNYDGSLNYPPTFINIPLECNFLAAQAPVSTHDVANRFSQLSIRGQSDRINSAFSEAFPSVRNISTETVAGIPSLYASVDGVPNKIPLASVSSGMNRIIAGLTALCKPKSVLLIDEIENGIYYEHLSSVWKMFISAAVENDSQMFATTHSEECLRAFVDSSSHMIDEVVLWRVSKGKSGAEVERFSGSQMKAALDRNIEIR